MDTAYGTGTSSPLKPGEAAAAGGVPHDTSILEPVERTIASLRRLASNYALLGVLDARRAAMQFAWLIAAGILITVLVVTAWLAAVVAFAVWLLGEGLSWPAVLGIAALLNLAAAAVVGWRVMHIFDQKPFSALMRQIRAEPPADRPQP